MDRIPLRLRRPRVGDVGWMLHRQAVLYHEEFSYHPVFEAYVARSFASYFDHHNERRDRIWVAARGEEVLGFIAIQHDHERRGWAKLRWFLVEPRARGTGIGRRLMAAALRFCKSVGFRGVSLWTVDDLEAAARIYQVNGFRVVEETDCPWAPWGRQQRWELSLASKAHRGHGGPLGKGPGGGRAPRARVGLRPGVKRSHGKPREAQPRRLHG